MEIPGGAAGVRRIGAYPSLNNPSSPGNIKPPQYRDQYWWSWRRCRHLVQVIKSRGIENGNEWHRLARIFQSVSVYKRAYIHRELSDVLSQASLDFLFEVRP